MLPFPPPMLFSLFFSILKISEGMKSNLLDSLLLKLWCNDRISFPIASMRPYRSFQLVLKYNWDFFTVVLSVSVGVMAHGKVHDKAHGQYFISHAYPLGALHNTHRCTLHAFKISRD